jgi:hypothetical protein
MHQRTVALCAVLCCAAAGARAQDTPPMPKPGPEHELLKRDVGVWDATVEMMSPQGGAPVVSKGIETSTLGPGGLWLLSDFKSEMMGQPFQGHGITGYDPSKRKYIGTWVDSMSSGLGLVESTYDRAARKMTGSFAGPDATGQTVNLKMVTEYKDDDTRVFTMYMIGPDGKETPSMRITYKRRK